MSKSWRASDGWPLGPIAASPDPELFTLLKGIYKTSASSTPTVGTACTAAVGTGATAETFDLTSVTTATFTAYVSLDGGTTYFPLTVTLGTNVTTEAAATAAEIVSDLAADTTFASYLTPSVSSSKLRLTSVQLGSRIKFYVPASTGANSLFGFTQLSAATAAAGTGTPATVNLSVVDSVGQAAPYARVRVRVYDGATIATANAYTSAVIQRVSVGTPVSGLGVSGDAQMDANSLGNIRFEICTSTASLGAYYLDFDGPSNYILVTALKSATGQLVILS